MVAGCATLPSGGAPRPVSGASTQAQALVLPEPPPPPTSARIWSPPNVVLGFLHATASYAIDPSVANDYVVPSLRGHWHRGPVTVIGVPSHLAGPPPSQKILNGSSTAATTTTVTLTADKLATLTQSGQYEYAPQRQTYTFTLALIDNVWRIKSLPSVGLLLMQSDFEQLYQQRNLYFYAPPTSAGGLPLLVPDPVYTPIEGSETALNTTVARNLVRGLFQDSGGWLAEPATSTAFPRGTALKSIKISNGTAVVDLGGGAANAGTIAIEQMWEQLKYTLTQSGYSPPIANQVHLEINGQLRYTTGPSNLIPQVSNGPEPAYFQDQTGLGQLVSGKKTVAIGPDELAGAQITAVAANPVSHSGTYNQLAVAVAAGNGCTVYTGYTVYTGAVGKKPTYRYSVSDHYSLSTSGGACTSLSWDNTGHIWASSDAGIWAIRSGKKGGVTPVAPPVMPGTGKKVTVLDLRIAPDAVRAALLVKTRRGSHAILLAAVQHSHGTTSFGQAVTAGTDLPDPLALSWFNPYNLAVLAKGQIYQVPLIGGAFTDLGLAPFGAQTLTTNGNEFVVGTAGGQILTSSASVSNWTHGPAGGNPAYPG